jgi:hypothetical protein
MAAQKVSDLFIISFCPPLHRYLRHISGQSARIAWKRGEATIVEIGGGDQMQWFVLWSLRDSLSNHRGHRVQPPRISGNGIEPGEGHEERIGDDE